MIIFLPPEDDWIQFSHTGRTCLKLPVYAVHDSLTIKVQLKSEALELTTILKTLVCAEVLVKALPAVRGSEDEIERISRDCFHKIHIRKLQLDNLDGSGKMVVHRG